MTNIKSTKRAFLSSVVAMLLCISMLIGTTFAWFTDSVTSAGNVITTGNLDIELDYWDGDSWETVQGTDALFTDNLWEPGHSEVVYLRLSNLGSLALKYQLSINVMAETPGTNLAGDTFYISDYIQMGVKENVNGQTTPYADRTSAVASVENASGIIGDGYISTGSMVAGAPEMYMAVVVYMPEAVGDEVNPKTGTAAPSITLGINLFATQFANEEDSFGTDYDKLAPIVSAPITRPERAVTLKGAENVMIGLSDAFVENLPAEITEIGMSVSEPVVDEDAKTITFATIELVDQNGEEIDLEALALGQKITVTLPAQNTFAPGELVVLYHDGEYVATAVVNADTTISYEVEHLCEVSVATPELPEADVNNVLTISNAAQLFGFAQSVNAGKTYEGITVVLANDIDLKGAAWTPIGSAYTDHGFMGNFDGNGKTIYNLYIAVEPDADGYAYAGFFGITEGTEEKENFVKDLTIENVTVNTTGNIAAAAIAYPYYTTVENITVCGDIAIKGGDYTSGVLAYTRRCVNASNIAINGNEGSYITGGITVGGVISDIQTNGGLVVNYSTFSASNVIVTGTRNVGGISGILCGQTLNGATVENVTLVCSDYRVGIVSGAYASAANKPVINNVKTSNVIGATAIAGAPYSASSSGYVIIDGVEYAGNYASFVEQLSTGTVNLACDVTVDANTAITLTAGADVVIYLNGNTLAGVSTETGANRSIIVVGKDAKLTVKNGTVSMKHTGANMGWNNSTNALEAVSGGDLTVENVHVINLGGSDMAYAVNIGNNGGATFKAINSTIESVNYNAFRVFNNADGAINVEFTEGTVLTGSGSPFFVHFWTEADLGSKQAARQAFLNVEFNDTVVSRYSGSKSLLRFGFTDAIYYSGTDMTTVVAANETALKAALANGKNVVLNNDISVDIGTGWKMGGANTKSITIDGAGFKLTLSSTYRSYFNMANAEGVLNLKNITLTNAHKGTHFFDYTTHFNCDVVADNVVFEKSPLVSNGATAVFNNCEFNQAGNDIYGLWIMTGTNVTVNGGVLNTDRGFKITDEDSAKEMTYLTVNGTKFNNSKKAAILVTTNYGAEVTLGNLDISNCGADSTNAVWIDDGRVETADLVKVTGASVIIEP